MESSHKQILFITWSAMIAAAYTALTIFAASLNLASGSIQVRFSEALTVLPAFTFSAVPGLFIGCIISNLITGCLPLDIVFGSLATLLGAFGTWALRKHHRFLASVPPIVSNGIIVPFVLRYVYEIPGSIPFFMLTVGIGEVISCGILGQLLYTVLLRRRQEIFVKPSISENEESSSDDV